MRSTTAGAVAHHAREWADAYTSSSGQGMYRETPIVFRVVLDAERTLRTMKSKRAQMTRLRSPSRSARLKMSPTSSQQLWNRLGP